MKTIATFAAAALALVSAPLAAHSFAVGPLRIGHPWARETAPAQTVGGGFLTITNTGKTADTLVSASSPAAKEVQIHTMSMDGGVMRMRRLTNGLPIPAGATIALKPGGYHLMLVGLKAPLKAGVKVPGELRFKNAGAVKIEFAVQSLSAPLPAEAAHAGH